MPYAELCPSSALAPYVDCFWLSEGGSKPKKNRILPDGCVDILFSIRGQISSTCADQMQHLKSGQAYLAGTMTAFADVTLSERASLFGVRFKPFGFSSFFKLPLDGLENGLVPFTELPTSALFDQSERLSSMASHLDSELHQHLRPTDARIQAAVELILQTGGQIKIDALVDVSCLSVRQFEKKFKQYLGVSAKVLCDVVRVKACANRLQNHQLDVMQVAVDGGYYDTAHFTNTFKRYVGQSPTHYRVK